MKKTSVDDVGLSKRARTALGRYGVHSVEELLQLNEEELYGIRNIGRKTVEELLQFINTYVPEKDFSDNEDFQSADEWIESEAGQNYVVTYLKEKDIRIDELETLSAKAFNILSFAGYEELYKIIFADEEYLLLNIPKMDTTSAKDVRLNVQYYIRHNKAKWFFEYQEQKSAAAAYAGVSEEERKAKTLEYIKNKDIPVTDLGLNNRAVNGLTDSGLNYLSDIVFLSEMSLKSIPKLGTGTAKEIRRRIDEYLTENEQRISAFSSGDMAALYSDDEIKNLILDLYKEIGFAGLSFHQILDQLKLPEFISEDKVKKLIGQLIASKELEYVDYRCHRVYPKFTEMLDQYTEKDERNCEIVRQRLSGNRLEEIGSDFDLTRERVRQIVQKQICKVQSAGKQRCGTGLFDEDYYRYFLNTYSVDKKDCITWLGIPTEAYYYIDTTSDHLGKEPLVNSLDDTRIDTPLKMKIEDYLNRDMIRIDGVNVPRRRSAIEDFLVPKLCVEDISFTDFTEAYNKKLKDSKIPYDEKLYYQEDVLRTRKNKISEMDTVLWKKNEMIRYYDIPSRDFSELLDVLNLESFENTEVSTAKFMDSYPEVMEKYDIRDQYELHNLLRKIIPEGSYNDFHCSRMPVIQFGKPDRDSAYLDLMMNNAPVSAGDLLQIIHDEYGFDMPTIQASSSFANLNPYYHQGMFSINQKELDPEKKEVLLADLEDDFYYTEEIRSRFLKLFPDSDPEEINPYSLKKMGFQVFSRKVLRNYPNLDVYFRNLLTEQDVIDITPYRKRFNTDTTFSATLNDMKKEMEIIEFDHNQFISLKKLEGSGFSKTDLQNFIDDVYEFVDDDTYFNSYSIQKDGFESELFDLGFSDCFYNSILTSDSRFSSTRIFNSIILCKGKADIAINTFLQFLIDRAGSIDIFDLMTDLEDEFGLETQSDKWKIINKISGTTVYYDPVLERLYSSKSLYYKELEETEDL